MANESLVNIIEGRILAEKRKHPSLDWIKLASIKIASDVVDRDEKQKTQILILLKKKHPEIAEELRATLQ